APLRSYSRLRFPELALMEARGNSSQRDVPEEGVRLRLVALQLFASRLQLAVLAHFNARHFPPLKLLELADETDHLRRVRFGEHGRHDLIALRVLPETGPARRQVRLQDRMIERLMSGDEHVVLLGVR